MSYSNVSEAYRAHKGDTNLNSHLFLYAKAHYIWHDVWDDLKWLVAVRNLLEPCYVRDGDVLSVLGDIVLPLLKESTHLLEEFIQRLSPSHLFHYSLRDYSSHGNSEERYEDRLLAGYLMIMKMTKTKKNNEVLIFLDDPDPHLLPTTTVCSKGGKHEPNTKDLHSKMFCTKCNQALNKL